MDQGTFEEYQLLDRLYRAHAAKLADEVLAMLLRLGGDPLGYRVSRLDHSLQTATRAPRDGADEELVAVALLHDIGDTLAPYNHADLPAAGASIDRFADPSARRFMLFVFVPPTAAAIPRLAERMEEITALGLGLFVIARARRGDLAGLRQRLGLAAPLIGDGDGAVARRYGCAEGGAGLLRPDRHGLARYPLGQPG